MGLRPLVRGCLPLVPDGGKYAAWCAWGSRVPRQVTSSWTPGLGCRVAILTSSRWPSPMFLQDGCPPHLPYLPADRPPPPKLLACLYRWVLTYTAPGRVGSGQAGNLGAPLTLGFSTWEDKSQGLTLIWGLSPLTPLPGQSFVLPWLDWENSLILRSISATVGSLGRGQGWCDTPRV